MQNIKSIPLGVFAVILIVSTLIAATPFNRQPSRLLPTYFSYSEEEVTSLYRFDSSKRMDVEELRNWDRVTAHLLEKDSNLIDSARLYAYLYTAQRDAAYLSYNIKQQFEGSLGPISRQVLLLFFPSASELQQNSTEDAYSILLSDIVISKMKARWQEDQQGIKPYPVKKGNQYWSSEDGKMFGQKFGSWKTWFLSSSDQLRPAAPPPYDNPFWKKQIADVKEACANLTKKQKEAIMYWAGFNMSGEKAIQNGDWLEIVNIYMEDHQVPFKKMLLVRSDLAMVLVDATAAVFDAKYTYLVKRPSMLDERIKIHLPNPSHPSYPSGHSTIGGASATLLDYFFPKDQNLWQRLAQEAGMSRIWCGIHFPLDHETGLQLGKKVAETAMKQIERSSIEMESTSKTSVPEVVPTL